MGDSLVTAGILAVVALSEGVRYVAPGSLVLERPRGRWRVARTHELGSGLRLVSLCIPCTSPAVLPFAPLDVESAPLIRERVATIIEHVNVSRAVGVAILAVLVAGLPYSAAHWSGFGLLGALALLLMLCVAQSLVTRRALGRLGERRGVGWRMLWPFSAPRAPQLLLEAALTGFSPLLVAHTLLPEGELLRSMRRDVYDALHGDDPQANELLTLYSRERLAQFIATRLDADGQPYCPRCASLYRSGTVACADCDSVALVV